MENYHQAITQQNINFCWFDLNCCRNRKDGFFIIPIKYCVTRAFPCRFLELNSKKLIFLSCKRLTAILASSISPSFLFFIASFIYCLHRVCWGLFLVIIHSITFYFIIYLCLKIAFRFKLVSLIRSICIVADCFVYLGQREGPPSHCRSSIVHRAEGLSSRSGLCNLSEQSAPSVCEYPLCEQITLIVLGSQEMEQKQS